MLSNTSGALSSGSEGGDESEPHMAWSLTMLELVTIVSCVLGSVLNSIIIILFTRRRGFRTTSNRSQWQW